MFPKNEVIAMKISVRHKVLIGLAAMMLLTGFLNYILFQPHIALFYYFKTEITTINPPALPPLFLTGYFSDIAWCAALCVTVDVLAELKPPGQTSRTMLLLLPFITEVAQKFHLLNGTFDWYDMLSYALVIAVCSLIFPSLIFIKMKKLKLPTWSLAVFVIFLTIAIASTAPRHTYQQPKPEPCVTHKAITYSPVLVKINISGSYTMKDLSGVQRYGYDYLMDQLIALSPGKYKLADGVTPNLELTITINTDSYQHYGATLNGYVYDGSFYYPWNNNYVTPEKLFEDIAAKVNVFVNYGWCKNCPSPCNP